MKAAKPGPVKACEALWVTVAGDAYNWTNAVLGFKAGEWHHCCPGQCGGGATFTEHEDGSVELRCREGVCTEQELIRALAGAAAC